MNLFFLKLYKKLPVISYDMLAVVAAWYIAYCLRFNLNALPINFFNQFSFFALLILITVQTGCYYYFKVYRGLWRFASINDLARIIKAVLFATLITIPILYLCSILHHIPRSVFLLYDMALIALLSSGRLVMRIYHERHKAIHQSIPKQVLIIGAGQAGESLVRDMKRSTDYFPLGFLDDDLAKRGLEIHGVRVLGETAELSKIAAFYQAELIFIAIPSARSSVMRRLVNLCEASKIAFQTLPGLSALAAGQVKVNALREVNLEDLLGRDQVNLEWEKIALGIKDKNVVITGGGGSIGAELCRQIVRLQPNKLMIIDHSEFNLYKIEQELKEHFIIALEPILISVTDERAVNYYFQLFKPQIVFHAAAYKHVPMLEQQVRAAVQNNILGTRIIAEASVAAGVEKFILISTDKAVNPANVMGTTKRVAEIYCQNLNQRVSTQFITVRFGNVLGSTGSVVPLFNKQLLAGGPLTVTHPEIQRYFMTIPEACQLILQAMVNGAGGEIFVLNMGEPIKISYLAEQMIRLSGKEPGRDIEIKYIGLRPGEKLYEELFHASEKLVQTTHEKLLEATFRQLDWQELMQTMKLLEAACDKHDNDELHILIKSLVPEFSPLSDLISN